MIKISIEIKGDKIADSLKIKNQTLRENSLIIRRLEEMKQKLLDAEFEPIMEYGGDC